MAKHLGYQSKCQDSKYFKCANPCLVYFRSFQTIYRIKTVDLSGIQTWIDGIEGKNADHLTTTTTAQQESKSFTSKFENLDEVVELAVNVATHVDD